MGTPFERNKYYFIKSITFYYIAKFEKVRGGFATFTDVGLVKNVEDWDQFRLTKGKGEYHSPSIIINLSAIVDAQLWE